MPFPLDPTFQSTGAPFLTGPDGVTAPDQGGNEIDLTGVPLTVAPASNALQAGDSATITAFAGVLLTVAGLTGMAAGSVGRSLTLNGSNPGNRGTFPIAAFVSPTSVKVTDAGGVFPDQNTGIAATISAFLLNVVTVTGLTGIQATDVGRSLSLLGSANPGNDGTFTILAVVDATSVKISNPAGVFPDANSGAIGWNEDIIPLAWSEAIDPTAFAPGDPLTFLADQLTPFNYMEQTFGPATGGGAVILPPNDDVDPPVGVPTGQNTPTVPANGTTGPVIFTDPQQPVRLQPTAELTVNLDPTSLAFGLEPIVQDGPAVRPPTPFIEVPEPGAEPSVTSGGRMIYGDVNRVVFSR